MPTDSDAAREYDLCFNLMSHPAAATHFVPLGPPCVCCHVGHQEGPLSGGRGGRGAEGALKHEQTPIEQLRLSGLFQTSLSGQAKLSWIEQVAMR